MRVLNSWTNNATGWFGEAVVSTAAGALIAVMLVPLTLFMASCWVDKRFVEPRRKGGSAIPESRHRSGGRAYQG